jgi:hypothetical protein
MKKEKEIDTELNNMIVLQDINVEGSPTPQGMKKVFVSYHILDIATGQTGMGNTCAVFNPIAYNDNLEKWIADVQKSIQRAIQDKTGRLVSVQVIFFR